MVFLPHDAATGDACQQVEEKTVEAEGLALLGWRDVPTSNALLGVTARASQPVIRQVFATRPDAVDAGLAFERRLLVVRRLIEKAVSPLRAARERRVLRAVSELQDHRVQGHAQRVAAAPLLP